MPRTRRNFVATGRRCAHMALLMALGAAGGRVAPLERSFGEVSTRADLMPGSEGIGSGVTRDITTFWLIPTVFTTGPAFNDLELVADEQPKLLRKQGTLSGNVKSELRDKAGNLWFSTSGEGAYRFDGRSFTNFTTKDGLCDNDVSAILEDRAGNILFGTKSGLCKFDGKSFSPYGENADLNELPATCLLEDRAGNLWVGTLSKGVFRYDGKTLANFLNKDDHKFNLGNHYQTILDILEDKSGNIWFSSWNGGGVWRYDGRTFKNFLPSPDYYLRNEDGRSGVSRVRPAGPTPPDESAPNDTISDDMIFSISEDRAGNLWFATRNHGACRYDGKSFTTFKGNERTYSIFEDKAGNVWITTNNNGVWRYDGKSFKNFTTKDGLINDSVFSVLEDTSGNLWFGTRGFGLSRYDGKSFASFSE